MRSLRRPRTPITSFVLYIYIVQSPAVFYFLPSLPFFLNFLDLLVEGDRQRQAHVFCRIEYTDIPITTTAFL
jgi:hypothetical protein